MWWSISARRSAGTPTSSGSGISAAGAPTFAPSHTWAASRFRDPGTPRRWSNLLIDLCRQESGPRTTLLARPDSCGSSIYAAQDRVQHGEVHDHVGDVAVDAHLGQRLQVHERRITHVDPD